MYAINWFYVFCKKSLYLVFAIKCFELKLMASRKRCSNMLFSVYFFSTHFSLFIFDIPHVIALGGFLKSSNLFGFFLHRSASIRFLLVFFSSRAHSLVATFLCIFLFFELLIFPLYSWCTELARYVVAVF